MKFSCLTNWLLQRGLLFNWLAFGLMLCAPTLISAMPGDLNLTFGTGGIAITNIRRADVASSMVVQTDGKIVIAGSSDTGGSLNSASLVSVSGLINLHQPITMGMVRPTLPSSATAFGIGSRVPTTVSMPCNSGKRAILLFRQIILGTDAPS